MRSRKRFSAYSCAESGAGSITIDGAFTLSPRMDFAPTADTVSIGAVDSPNPLLLTLRAFDASVRSLRPESVASDRFFYLRWKMRAVPVFEHSIKTILLPDLPNDTWQAFQPFGGLIRAPRAFRAYGFSATSFTSAAFATVQDALMVVIAQEALACGVRRLESGLQRLTQRHSAPRSTRRPHPRVLRSGRLSGDIDNGAALQPLPRWPLRGPAIHPQSRPCQLAPLPPIDFSASARDDRTLPGVRAGKEAEPAKESRDLVG